MNKLVCNSMIRFYVKPDSLGWPFRSLICELNDARNNEEKSLYLTENNLTQNFRRCLIIKRQRKTAKRGQRRPSKDSARPVKLRQTNKCLYSVFTQSDCWFFMSKKYRNPQEICVLKVSWLLISSAIFIILKSFKEQTKKLTQYLQKRFF